MSATLEQAEAVERGGLLRDAGILRASEKKTNREPAGLLRAESRFLDVLVSNETATSDDTADDLDKPHDDGGRWLGGIFLRLSRQGLIVEVGSARSCRPIRHRGKLTLWAIGNREAIERRRRDVKAMLDGLNATPESSAVIVERLIVQANGRLMRGDDPRLSQHSKTGESAVTDSPAISNATNPSNGDTTNGQAE